MKPVGRLSWTAEEQAEHRRTGKWPERLVRVPDPPGPPEPSPAVPSEKDMSELGAALGKYWTLLGKIEGRREDDEKRHAELSSHGKTGGDAKKKEKPWRQYARMLAPKIPEASRTLSDSAIARVLLQIWVKKKPAQWEEKIPGRPPPGTLRKFVAELREDGTYPPRSSAAS